MTQYRKAVSKNKCKMTQKQMSQKGGRSKSAKKLRAVRLNIKKAVAARWPKKSAHDLSSPQS